jgi:UDP-3-O-[3-hydroxymyristoyl] glucosamine N-acyltransferase
MISDVATLESARPDELAFFTNPRYRAQAEVTRAGAVLVGPSVRLEGRDLLVADEPYVALAGLLSMFHPTPPPPRGVSPDARIAEDVRLGADAYVGPFAVVGRGCSLGDRCSVGPGTVLGEDCDVGEDTILAPRVVLYPGTRVGARCLVHSGVVLGADGFGFATSGGRHVKIPQVGRVVVEDDVEIGALSAVDRASVGETRIGSGTKIDDLVMIAHGVTTGPGCLLAAQSGIAGSTHLGGRVTLAGQSGVTGHVKLGDGVVVASKSAVYDDVAGGAFVAGIPAVDHMEWKRSVARVRRLARLQEEVRSLEARIAALESAGGRRKGETP